MRNRITIYEQEIANNPGNSSVNALRVSPFEPVVKDTPYTIFAEEGREHFFNYVEWLGLDKDPNLVVLSSLHHYYYDAEEMKSVTTVVNLKELNYIKQTTSFLHSIFHIMPSRSYFVGCFVDNKKQNGFALRNTSSDYHSRRNSQAVENGILSSIPFLNMIFSFMDAKTNKYLSSRDVTLLLSDHGFKVLDITELNGITYFCAQKLQTTEN